MRALAAAMPAVVAALLATADDRRLAPPVEAIVPVPPTEHQGLALLGPAPSSPRPGHRDHQRRGVRLRPRQQAPSASSTATLRGVPPHGAPHSAGAHSVTPCWCATAGSTASASRRLRPGNKLIS